APAPQLHVHGDLIGLLREDGRLVAINSEVIFGDAAFEAGAYARTHLAQCMVAMGFEIEWGTGKDGLYFEIKGISKDLLGAMSGRSQEIEEEARRREADRGWELTNRERATLAMFTRLAKEGTLTTEQVEVWWRARCEEFGFGPR